MFFIRRQFTITERQSAYIDDVVYENKKLPEEKKECKHRSDYIRKLIFCDMNIKNEGKNLE